jgi:aminoglycoside phosphotransferase (APT) family kinase protein
MGYSGEPTACLDRLHRAEVIAARLRAAGYPVARNLALGSTPEGGWYQLQEFVAWEPIAAPLTAAHLDLLLALNDKQAQQRHTEDIDWLDWSRYARDVVFANASGWAEALRSFSPATRDLLAALQDWAAPHADAPLSTADAVHGDFLPEQVLVRDGQVAAVIDFTQAGCGTRALDLARTLMWWYEDMAEAERQRLLDHIATIATEAERAICLACQVIDVVAFVTAHHPHDVARYVRRGYHLLDMAR